MHAECAYCVSPLCGRKHYLPLLRSIRILDCCRASSQSIYGTRSSSINDNTRKGRKAIYAITGTDIACEHDLLTRYSKNRIRDLEFAKTQYIWRTLSPEKALELLRSSNFTKLYVSFYASFGTPPLPRSILDDLINTGLLSMCVAVLGSSADIIGASFYSIIEGDEIWIPWVIYDRRCVRKGLPTFIWHNTLLEGVNLNCRIFNLGTSSMYSGVANFKETLSASPVLVTSEARYELNKVQTKFLSSIMFNFVNNLPASLQKWISVMFWKFFAPLI